MPEYKKIDTDKYLYQGKSNNRLIDIYLEKTSDKEWSIVIKSFYLNGDLERGGTLEHEFDSFEEVTRMVPKFAKAHGFVDNSFIYPNYPGSPDLDDTEERPTEPKKCTCGMVISQGIVHSSWCDLT